MMSTCTAEHAPPSTADRLLDAARESVLAVGWRRTTLSDVARRAGVSRTTAYRAFPDVPALFSELGTREWTQVAQEVVATQPASGSARGKGSDAIAASVVAFVQAMRGNALLQRVVGVDPDLLLPYLLERRGRTQDAVLEVLASRIAAAQEVHEVRAGDPVVLARALVLAAHGWVFSASTMTDAAVSDADLDAELGELVRRYLS